MLDYVSISSMLHFSFSKQLASKNSILEFKNFVRILKVCKCKLFLLFSYQAAKFSNTILVTPRVESSHRLACKKLAPAGPEKRQSL